MQARKMRLHQADDDVEVLPHAEDVQRSVQGTVARLASDDNRAFEVMVTSKSLFS